MSAREPVTSERIQRFLRELGRRYRGKGRLYLVGGTQMVYAGFRRQPESLRVDEDDFLCKFGAFLRLAHDQADTAR